MFRCGRQVQALHSTERFRSSLELPVPQIQLSTAPSNASFLPHHLPLASPAGESARGQPGSPGSAPASHGGVAGDISLSALARRLPTPLTGHGASAALPAHRKIQTPSFGRRHKRIQRLKPGGGRGGRGDPAPGWALSRVSPPRTTGLFPRGARGVGDRTAGTGGPRPLAEPPALPSDRRGAARGACV